MDGKRFVALFIVVLLTLLAGSRAYAQGQYDRNVAAKFVGKWQSTRYTEYLIIEDHSTYAVARFCAISPSDPNCNHPLWTQSPLFTHEGKLINSFVRSDGREVDEFVILGNGHLLWTYTVFYPDNTQKSFLGSEFVRTGGSSPPPVTPVQPVVPGVSQCSEGLAYAPNYSPSGITVYAAENKLQCTEYVRTLPQWKNLITWHGDAYEWDDGARNAHVLVDQNPREGDIAVWERGCGKASKKYGHVAYVVDVRDNGNTIIVNEANWITRDHPEGDGKVHQGKDYPVESCMSFIHPMSGPAQQPQSSPPIDKCSQYAWWDPRGWWCRVFGK